MIEVKSVVLESRGYLENHGSMIRELLLVPFKHSQEEGRERY